MKTKASFYFIGRERKPIELIYTDKCKLKSIELEAGRNILLLVLMNVFDIIMYI